MKKRRGTAILGILICLLLCPMIVHAESEQKDGLEVSYTAEACTEKGHEENVKLNLTVVNGNAFSVHDVTLSQMIPEGLEVIEGESLNTVGELATGERKTVQVEVQQKEEKKDDGKADPEKSDTNQTGKKPGSTSTTAKTTNPTWKSIVSSVKTGDTTGKIILLSCMLFLLSGGIVAFLLRHKKKNKLFSILFLAFLMAGMLWNYSTEAKASSDQKEIKVEQTVTVGGKEYQVTGCVTYRALVSTVQQVTVSFETFEGQPIEPVTIQKGALLEDVPRANCATKTFLGWYLDAELTKQFFSANPIEADLTLYACYTSTKVDFQSSDANEEFEEDCDPMRAIQLLTNLELTSENLAQYVTIQCENDDDSGSRTPKNFAVEPIEGGFQVTPESPGYTPGASYLVTLLSEDICFQDKPATLRTFRFRIYKEQIELTDERAAGETMLDQDGNTWTDGGFFTIPWSDVISQNNLTFLLKKTETTSKLTKGDPDRRITYSTLRISDSAELGDNEEQSFYGNVKEIQELDHGGERVLQVEFEKAEPQDVFNELDVYSEQPLDLSQQMQQVDTEEIVENVRNSEALYTMTETLAEALNDSATLQEMTEDENDTNTISLNGENELLQTLAIHNSFTDQVKETSKIGITVDDLMEGLTIEAYTGDATNENFDVMSQFPFDYVRLVIKYDTTIKKSVNLHIEFELNECMLMSALAGADGSVHFDWKTFTIKSDIVFEFAIRTWSQTDVGLTILVSSTNDGPEQIDISSEIKDAMKADVNDVTGDAFIDNLKDTMDVDSKPINLVSVPLADAKTSIAKIITFQVKAEMNVNVDFSAGLTTNYSHLSASEIGVRGQLAGNGGPKISTYKNQLTPIPRYEFNLYACGHLGVEAGFQMGMYVGVLGLDSFGKVGVEGEFGAYTDLYGYVYLNAKQLGMYRPEPTTTFAGGYYLDMGLYFDFRLVAVSDIFHAKASIGISAIFDPRISLYSLGNKEMLAGFADTTFENNTKNISSASGDAGHVESLPYQTLTGKFLDITNLKITQHGIEKDDLSVKSNSQYFDATMKEDGTIELKQHTIPEYVKELTFSVTVYYDGGTTSFSSNGAIRKINIIWKNSKYYAEDGNLKTVPIYYHLSGKINGEDVTSVITVNEMVGNRIGYCTLNGNQFAEYYVITGINGRNGVAIGDTVEEAGSYHYDLSLRPIQTCVYYNYISTDPKLVPGDLFNNTITEVYCYNLGEIPDPGMELSGSYVTFDKWSPAITRIPGASKVTKCIYNGEHENGEMVERLLGNYRPSNYINYRAEYQDKKTVTLGYSVALNKPYLYGDDTLTYHGRVGSFPVLATYANDSDEWTRYLPKEDSLNLPKGYHFEGWERDTNFVTPFYNAILKRNKVTLNFDFGKGYYLSDEDVELHGYENVNTVEGSILSVDNGSCKITGMNDNFVLFDTSLFPLPSYYDDEGYYTFDSWMDKNNAPIESDVLTENMTLYAKYKSKALWSYEITFAFGDGVVDSAALDFTNNRPEGTKANQFAWSSDGKTLTYKGGTAETNAAVLSWVKENSMDMVTGENIYLSGWKESDVMDMKTGSRGVSYTAEYDPQHQFHVTFSPGEGTWANKAQPEINGISGTGFTFPEVKKDASETKTYALSGWRSSKGVLITETNGTIANDESYTAEFTEQTRYYTVKFHAEDGTFAEGRITAEYQFPYDTDLATEDIAEPSKEATVKEVYTFSGWNAPFVKVTGDQEYYAVYNTAVRQYEITFDAGSGEFEDGNTTRKESFDYGTYLGDEGIQQPTKADDATYHYEFKGWTPELSEVTADATYEAVYKKTLLETPEIGITITDGANSEDVSANSMPDAYGLTLHSVDEGYNGDWYEITLKKDNLEISGTAENVMIICGLNGFMKNVTFRNLSITNHLGIVPLTIFPENEETTVEGYDFTAYIKGDCLFKGNYTEDGSLSSTALNVFGRNVTFKGDGAETSSITLLNGIELGDYDRGEVVYYATVAYEDVHHVERVDEQ